MNKQKNIFNLIFLQTLVLFIVFIPYILKGIPVSYGTDLKPQWFLFYTEFQNLMKNFLSNKAFPFYSWSLFLGNNFYSSKSFYLMGDLYAYIGLLFKGLNFFEINFILEILKYYVAGISMYYYLDYFNFNNKTKLIGSLSYAFSSWAIFFSGQMVFLSFYSFMPLYFLGVEKYLKNNKVILFILATSLLLSTNYYLFFSVSLLTPIYFIYRYYIINSSLKGLIISALKAIFYYIVGVLIVSILILPAFYYITESDRMGKLNFFELYNLRVYLHEIVNLFIPNYLYIYKENIFEFEQISHVHREMCLYSSSIIALLLPQFLCSKDKKYKKATIILYSILMLFMIFPVFSKILHAFSDSSYRWLMILIFINILTVCHTINDIENINKKLLFNSMLIICLICIIIPLITIFIYKLNILNYKLQFILFIIFALVYVMNYFIISKNKNILIFLVIEIILSSSALFHTNIDDNSVEKGFVNSVTHVLQKEDNQLNNFLNNLDDKNYSQYYRVYVDKSEIYWDYSHNMSIIYKLKGLMTYDSTYSTSLSKLKLYMPSVKDFNSEWIFNIKDEELLKFLNVKYAISLNELNINNFKYIKDYNGFKVYENTNYRDLGTTYSDVNTYDNFDKTSLNYTVFVDDKDYEEIKSLVGNGNSKLTDIKYGNNYLYGRVESEDDSFMVLTLPYDKGWNIKVNNKSVKTYNVSGGFIGFKVEKGDNNISMIFTPYGFKMGAIFSFVGIFLFFGIIFIRYIKGERNK